MYLGGFVADLMSASHYSTVKLKKIDSSSFQTILRLFQFAQLLKRGEFMLELKRGGHARVRTEMIEFIALPFPSTKKFKIWSFHVVVVLGR